MKYTIPIKCVVDLGDGVRFDDAHADKSLPALANNIIESLMSTAGSIIETNIANSVKRPLLVHLTWKLA